MFTLTVFVTELAEPYINSDVNSFKKKVDEILTDDAKKNIQRSNSNGIFIITFLMQTAASQKLDVEKCTECIEYLFSKICECQDIKNYVADGIKIQEKMNQNDVFSYEIKETVNRIIGYDVPNYFKLEYVELLLTLYLNDSENIKENINEIKKLSDMVKTIRNE